MMNLNKSYGWTSDSNVDVFSEKNIFLRVFFADWRYFGFSLGKIFLLTEFFMVLFFNIFF